MKSVATLGFRIALAGLCVFISWRSIRLAAADLASAPDTAVSLARAIEIEPDSADFVARAALLRADSGDPSPDVDRELEHALQLNPVNAEVMIAIGLRREFEGRTAEAAKWLERAADIDHAFRASWAWAGFCSRNGRPDETWAMLKRMLSLEPLGYDPQPVFDLAWRSTPNSARILAIVPQTGPRSVQYLNYLMGTKRLDAAVEAWPQALNSLDPSTPVDAAALAGFPQELIAGGRLKEAVRSWNQLVERHILQSGKVNPEEGVWIADPSFNFTAPAASPGFGWRPTPVPGAFVGPVPSMMRLEFDGNEPESVALFSALAPVVPGKTYRLTWKYDASRLKLPTDGGFAFTLKAGSAAPLPCGPALARPESGSCMFTVTASGQDPQEYTPVQIGFGYARALGTVRARGELRFTEVRLEFGS